MTYIYKIVTRDEWDAACKTGVFLGAAVDLADGFIHFSTAAQLAETANKHFRDKSDLLLLKVDETALGVALRYEVSRGGALFPHFYAHLPVSLVQDVSPFAPDENGVFTFSEQKL